ncbi:Multidrug resistance protein MdtH [uncultured archaeon]|nr:Multidrug resistance protein MdtH [uncultured archaeon]
MKIFGVNLNILLLGIVSFLTDVSSEMIFSVFSIFFTAIIGGTTALLGIVEGLADFSASSLDYIAGYLSDKTGKHKTYAMIGYGFSTLAKASLLTASTVHSLFAFRIVERLGKSFRGPPRDSWIAAISEKQTRGYSFGIHKALDKAGAVLGPFIAFLLLSWLGQNISTFKLLFVIALVPAALSVILLLFIRDKKSKPAKKENIFKAYFTLNKEFKRYLFIACLFSLAYFSFSFLLLKAYQAGFAIKDVVLLYALFNISFVLVSAPIGKLGDKIGRSRIIMLSYLLYLLMCVGFIFATSKAMIILLFIIFGIFFAIDEGQTKAYISDLEKSRGTAIGVYNFFTGLVYLPASVIAGWLWMIKPEYAFAFAGAISFTALILFTVQTHR